MNDRARQAGREGHDAQPDTLREGEGRGPRAMKGGGGRREGKGV